MRVFRKHILLLAALSAVGCGSDPPPTGTNLDFLVMATSVYRGDWFYPAIPTRPIVGPATAGPATAGDGELTAAGRGALLWFSPGTVLTTSIDPSRPPTGETLSTLEIIYAPETPPDGSPPWGGLTTVLSRQGDVSAGDFLEVWVNDRIPTSRSEERAGTFHVDVGVVGEDAVWDPLVPPAPNNASLDTEDADGSGSLTIEEDTGFDRRFSAIINPGNFPTEPTPPNDGRGGFQFYSRDVDPSGDDQVAIINGGASEATVQDRIAKFLGLNGAEFNGTLDTEDLDRDGELDTVEGFLTYTIDLASEPTIDVVRDRGGVGLENGWRLYRVPLTDSVQEVGIYDPTHFKHVRIWFDDVPPGEILDLQFVFIGMVTEDVPDEFVRRIPPTLQ